MTWFKVDDGFSHHAKAVAAGNPALGLWVRAGAWSSQQLTDGFVPTAMARDLGTPAQARNLVAAGLWIEKDTGYVFHDWKDRNPSRIQVEAERHYWRERQRRARRRRGEAE
jgi:hypothetical protein